MYFGQGEGVHAPDGLPGARQRPAPQPVGPTPMTIVGSSATCRPNSAATTDTPAQQIFRGITNVSAALGTYRASRDPGLTPEAAEAKLREFAQSEEAKALAVYEAMADQLVAQKQAACDQQLAALSPDGDTAGE